MTHPLHIDSRTCTGCGKCIKACPFGALHLEGGFAQIEPELCCLCGACTDSCPFKAISLDEAHRNGAAIKTEEYRDIWVFVEMHNGAPDDSAFELLAEGRRLADIRACALAAVVFGSVRKSDLQALAAAGADCIYRVEEPSLDFYEPNVYADVLARLIDCYKPEIVLAAATTEGRGFIPRVAARVYAGLTADCTALAIDPRDGALIQTRPAFGGNIMAEIVTPEHRPQMATIRPRVFRKGGQDASREARIVDCRIAPCAALTRVLRPARESVGCDLTGARIVVAGGRGLKNRRNFDLLFRLAAEIGGVVAASRACVDAGWISAAHQVGQTGRTVNPDLYLAFGISGAIQHLEGMRSSGRIVAVNSDPHAPIMDVADIAVVGDLFDVIPQLMAML